jgi:hypothetical protein
MASSSCTKTVRSRDGGIDAFERDYGVRHVTFDDLAWEKNCPAKPSLECSVDRFFP